jgi:hypothetical protein
VSFNGYCFGVIGIYGVFAAFAQQIESMFFEIFNQVASLYRHAKSLQVVAPEERRRWVFLYLVVDMPLSSPGGRL